MSHFSSGFFSLDAVGWPKAVQKLDTGFVLVLTDFEDIGDHIYRDLPSFKKEFGAFNESTCRSLVLNSTFEPIKVVNWQKAIILWLQDKVEVLEFHEAAVRSARKSFRLPSVMRLKKYIRPLGNKRIKFSRENVYLRDNYTCQYCYKKFSARDLTLDHVIPASKSGMKTWTNVVTACRECNHKKANRTPLAAQMPLLTQPKMPEWLPTYQLELNRQNVPESWLDYLFFSENTGQKLRAQG